MPSLFARTDISSQSSVPSCLKDVDASGPSACCAALRTLAPFTYARTSPSPALLIAAVKALFSVSVLFAVSLADLNASIADCLSEIMVQPWNFSYTRAFNGSVALPFFTARSNAP